MKTRTLWLALIAIPLAAAPGGEVTGLPVRLFYPRSVGSGTIREAVQIASRIFGRAGLAFNWLPCPQDAPDDLCNGDEGMKILVIQTRAKDNGLGIALQVDRVLGTEATVFFANVRDAAHRAGVHPAVALGSVVAHEIGHLLGLADRERGVMHAVFADRDLQRAARGQLTFLEDESELLRFSIAARSARGRSKNAEAGATTVLK